MCVLHVGSDSESLAAFVAETSLPIYQSHAKGDVRSARKGTHWENYGFSCAVSDREFSDFPGQVADAIGFLTTHRQALGALRARHRIDDIRLDFPIASRLSERIVGQFDYLPPALSQLCAEHGIGIEMSQYACADDQAGSQIA